MTTLTTTISPLAVSVFQAGKRLASESFRTSTYNGTAEGKVAAIADFGRFITEYISDSEFLSLVRYAERQATNTGAQGDFGRAYLETLETLMSL